MKWFRGYLLVTIKGYSPERFINLCSSRDILIWNLRQVENGYEFYITVKGFLSLKQIVKKTHTRPYIKERYGLPFYLHRYRKRKIFLIGILVFVALLYTFSIYIWDISIQGGYTHTTDALIKYLNTQNVYSGVLKKNINCTKIEETLRKEYNDIGWVSAEIKGTRLIIKIVETNMPEMKEKVTKPSHIIATKDGLVTSIITRAGTPNVAVGSVVKKGDVLVSGILQIFGDDGSLINNRTVVADADILLKTYYDYKAEFNLDYIDKIYTNKKKSGFSISLFNKKIDLLKPFKYYKKYDIIEDQEDIKLGDNFYLPFKYFRTSYVEYNEVNKTYSKEEAIEIAKQKIQLYLNKLKDRKITILENNVQITIENGKCKAEGKIIVEESAVRYKTIQDEEWELPTPSESPATE